MMRVLLVGNGGREHALARALVQSDRLTHLYVAPGNGGTLSLPKTENVAIAASDIAGLTAFAQEHGVELTVVGPEAPLVDGLADALTEAGLRVFGPSKAASQIEGSKAFSKAFMQRHDIATGAAQMFDELDAALVYLDGLDDVPVIKASGLAAGKGVILPHTMDEARRTLYEILLERQFGAAGDVVLIEERMSGPEVSVLAFCDGESVAVMPAAQDHKRLLDGDAGPNTGGMGAFAPAPLATPELLKAALTEVLLPTVHGLAAEGAPFVGVLYAGLMLTEDGSKVLEFNCRFGDPETQVILPLLKSDLLDVINACVDGVLGETAVEWSHETTTAVVAASGGYPGAYDVGKAIRGVKTAEETGCVVYHAGTALVDGALVTSGGRVLAVTGMGDDLSSAIGRAYDGVGEIGFEGMQYRKDIGMAAG